MRLSFQFCYRWSSDDDFVHTDTSDHRRLVRVWCSLCALLISFTVVSLLSYVWPDGQNYWQCVTTDELRNILTLTCRYPVYFTCDVSLLHSLQYVGRGRHSTNVSSKIHLLSSTVTSQFSSKIQIINFGPHYFSVCSTRNFCHCTCDH